MFESHDVVVAGAFVMLATYFFSKSIKQTIGIGMVHALAHGLQSNKKQKKEQQEADTQ